jgi:hypothetical protein
VGFEASALILRSSRCAYGWGFIIVLAYVDDFLLAAPDGSGLCDWFAELRKVFEVRDLGEPVLYVGIEFSLEPGVVRLTQAEAMQAGAEVRHGRCQSKQVPMATTMHLVPLTSEETITTSVRITGGRATVARNLRGTSPVWWGCWGATVQIHKAAHGSSAWSAAVRRQHSEYGDRVRQ